MNINLLLYFDELLELKMPKDDYMIYGSCPLVIRGIKLYNTDIDVIVRKRLWEKLSKIYQVYEGIGIGNTFRQYIIIKHIEIDYTIGDFTTNAEELIDKSDIVNGYRFMTFEDTLRLKRHMNRDKDVKDFEKIKSWSIK